MSSAFSTHRWVSSTPESSGLQLSHAREAGVLRCLAQGHHSHGQDILDCRASSAQLIERLILSLQCHYIRGTTSQSLSSTPIGVKPVTPWLEAQLLSHFTMDQAPLYLLDQTTHFVVNQSLLIYVQVASCLFPCGSNMLFREDQPSICWPPPFQPFKELKPNNLLTIYSAVCKSFTLRIKQLPNCTLLLDGCSLLGEIPLRFISGVELSYVSLLHNVNGRVLHLWVHHQRADACLVN